MFLFAKINYNRKSISFLSSLIIAQKGHFYKMKKHPVFEINKFYCNSHQNDWYCQPLKPHLQTHGFIEKSHSHNFYLMVLFTKGSGTHTVDFDSYQISPGCLYVLQPGQVHSWDLSEDIDGYIAFYSQQRYNLYFNKKLEAYNFYRSSKNSPEIQLSPIQSQRMEHYFEMLIEENNQNEFKKQEQLLNLLDLMHIELARIYTINKNHNQPSYHEKINELERILQLYYLEEKSPSFYADKMNLSLKHLNRICKEVLNTTLTDFIAKKIILESKRMLAVDYTVSEVATALGYTNYSYFTKFFKKQTGYSPLEFKKNHKS